MARIVASSASSELPLDQGWEWTRTAAGEAASPAELSPNLPWRPARVPGTVAQSMRNAGLWDGRAPLRLDDNDFWFRAEFAGGREEVLEFDGLATIAEAWLNGERILVSRNMFLSHPVDVTTRRRNVLHVAFRSLARELASRRGRARWRPRMISPGSLRFARTTLLGRMPGWCPEVQAVGPWRPIRRITKHEPRLTRLELRASLSGTEGRMHFRAVVQPEAGRSAILRVGTTEARLEQSEAGHFLGDSQIPDVQPWWPHTHGTPHLYPVSLSLGSAEFDLGRIGFRQISLDRGADGSGFALRINGETIFCRGACWTSTDLVGLPDTRAACLPWLESMRDAGMNMVRISGNMLYECDAFYELCGELGLMVWQDFMLSNFDYPMQDEEFVQSLTREAEQFLDRTQARASLAVLCGGSEVMQQAAMLGLKREACERGPHTDLLPAIAARWRPDVPYVANSPSGSGWPFGTNTGVTHYYGVGAYQRPLEDARRAGVRFASECLGLSNVPCTRTVEDCLPVASITDPLWKQGVPRDAGASWDFEDVRDHYIQRVFGLDPLQLRRQDFARYLDISRAVNCVLMEAVFAEWRRAGSGCAGGLVWQFQDLRPGAGWGVVDSLGRPKPGWHALRRAFRSRQLILTDEGLNGLDAHLLNETPAPMHARLHLVCLRDGKLPVRRAEQELTVPPRGAIRLTTSELLPEFFDITYAYRFGPPPLDVTAAWITEAESGALIADAYHFPSAPLLPPRDDAGLRCTVEHRDGDWVLRLRAEAFLQFLHVEDRNFLAEEDWFHLPPGLERAIRLVPVTPETRAPAGEVHALNLTNPVGFRGRE